MAVLVADAAKAMVSCASARGCSAAAPRTHEQADRQRAAITGQTSWNFLRRFPARGSQRTTAWRTSWAGRIHKIWRGIRSVLIGLDMECDRTQAEGRAWKDLVLESLYASHPLVLSWLLFAHRSI